MKRQSYGLLPAGAAMLAVWVFLIAGLLVFSAALAMSTKLVAGATLVLAVLVLMLLVSPNAGMVIAVLTCFFLVGPAESLGRIDRVFWASYFVAALLAVKALFLAMGNAQHVNRLRAAAQQYGRSSDVGEGLLRTLIGALAAVGIFSTIFAGSPVPQMLLATRDYLWMWGLLAIVLASRMEPLQLVRNIRLLPWVVVLQVPLVAYQRYGVSSGRVRSWDAVVGLFGGNPDGGGASGAMGVFSLLMACYTVVRARAGLTSYWFASLVCISAMFCIALAEVKFVPLIAPLVVLSVFGIGAVLRNPKVLLGLFLVIICSPLILYGYWRSFESAGTRGYGSFNRYLEVIVERNVDERDISLRSVEMGRVAALRFWWDQADLRSRPVETLVGYGAGSTRIGMFAGEVAKKYPFKVARSSLAVLLWELGLVGSVLAFMLLILALWRAVTIRVDELPLKGELGSALRLSAGVVVAALLCLPYNNDLVGTPQMQMLFVLACAVISRARASSREAQLTRQRDAGVHR